MKKLVIFAACAVLAGCAALAACAASATTPTSATANIGEPFELAPGQVAPIAGTSVQVRFDRVTDDSRCPTEVQCVWEGDATVVLALDDKSSDPDTRDLHTSRRYAREAQYHGLVIRLEDVKPYPRTSDRIPAGDYRITLLVEKP
jgi:hypothetical protein